MNNISTKLETAINLNFKKILAYDVSHDVAYHINIYLANLILKDVHIPLQTQLSLRLLDREFNSKSNYAT